MGDVDRYHVGETIREDCPPGQRFQVIDLDEGRTVAYCHNEDDANRVAKALQELHWDEILCQGCADHLDAEHKEGGLCANCLMLNWGPDD